MQSQGNTASVAIRAGLFIIKKIQEKIRCRGENKKKGGREKGENCFKIGLNA